MGSILYNYSKYIQLVFFGIPGFHNLANAFSMALLIHPMPILCNLLTIPEYECSFLVHTLSVLFRCLVMSDSLRPHGRGLPCQASLSITNSGSLLKLTSIDLVTHALALHSLSSQRAFSLSFLNFQNPIC